VKDRFTTLQEIRAAAPAHLAQAADRWLNEDGIEETAGRPGEIEVDHAASLWRLRAQHVREAGKHLVGAEEFLAKLATLNPEKKLQQYSFHGAEHTGIVFFEKTNRKYVGVLIVEAMTNQPPLDANLVAEAQTI
jgi:hypothetical protein